MSLLTGFPAFLLVGALAAGVNIVARATFSLVVSFEVAVVLAFPVALTTAFVLNRAFVFTAHDNRIVSQYGKFLFVNLLALLQVYFVSVGLARFLFPAIDLDWHPEIIAHGVGVLSPVLTSYYAHRHYTFGNASHRRTSAGPAPG